MNIYLQVEISSRELESKILLAALAAERGHNVVISELNLFKAALDKKLIPKGIFHAKSLTPNINLIARHQQMIDDGFLVTSIDEEGGILDYEYDEFAKNRYSDKTLEQSSAIFCWGSEDINTLKKIYPKHVSKIHKTGSPRVDLWKSQFSGIFDLPSIAPSKPFLLVSSNLHTVNFRKPFYQWGGFKSYKTSNERNYFESDPHNFKKQFQKASEDNLKLAAFVEAVHFLAKNNSKYEIVFRPHPLENLDAWKFYLSKIPNVHVIREGSINPWLNNAFAVMHNSCTTAIEASINGKEIVTFIPFKQNQSWGEVANSLGYKAETLKDLKSKIDEIFENSQNPIQIDVNKKIPQLLVTKIYLDENELAAKKILKVWEDLAQINNLENLSLAKFEFFLKTRKIRKFFKEIFKRKIYSKENSQEDDYKFPKLDIIKIRKTLNKIQNILKIQNKLECKQLYDRTILIKKS